MRVEGLAAALGVSPVTVHRDLQVLEGEGRVRRVRGGAVLTGPEAPAPSRCGMCGAPVGGRWRMLLHLQDGSVEPTCCPHCGLLRLERLGSRVASALVPDFLYGRAVGAGKAVYLVGSRVRPCCVPSVLAFEDRGDALCFQQGFGGEVADIGGALALLLPSVTPSPGEHRC